jgi:hypothetical protein
MDASTGLSKFESLDFDNKGSSAAPIITSISDNAASASLRFVLSDQQKDVASGAIPDLISSNFSYLTNAGLTITLYEAISHLAGRSDGWRGPGSKALQAESLRNFLAFWVSVNDVAAEPAIALSPDGSIHAEWIQSDQKRLDIQFSGRRVLFGMIANNKNVWEGAEDWTILAPMLKAHPIMPLLWGGK